MEINEILLLIEKHTNLITALAAIGALVISTVAIIKSSQDNKKQIVVGKVEEIYELVIFLYVEYNQLYKLEIKLEECGNENDENYADAIWEYEIELEKLKKKVDLDDLFNKALRLHVLANSYLTNDLKQEILLFNKLFESIILTLKIQNLSIKNEEYPEGFPTNESTRNFVAQLATKLIAKINMY